MSIITQTNLIGQSIVANGLTTGNKVQNPNNLLNTTDSTAIFGLTSDVIIGNFPFNLPQDAVIVGISGVMKARIDNSSIPTGSLTPVLVDSVTGDSFVGTAVTGLSDVLQEYDLGGAYDIWGNLTWTADKINNIRLQLIGNSALEVAWVTLTVYYYIPQVIPTPPPFDLPGCEDCDSAIQALPFELAQPWLTNQTSLILKSFNLPTGEAITLEMLGECGGTINLTIDPDLRAEDGGNFIENFNIDADIASITNLPNGTVEIDLGNINQRGLAFVTPYGHNTDNISEHAVGAVVIITNNGPFNGKLLKRCHIGTLISAPVEVQDEGDTVVVAMDKLNFIGENVQAEQDNSDPRKANVTVIANPTNTQPTEENTVTNTNNTTPSLTLTTPLTVTDANYLRVAIITEEETISSVTYDGVAMDFIAEEINNPYNLKVALYGLINPAVGANDVVVTMANASIITTIATGWLDVDTTNPVDGISSGATGLSDTPTDNATTTTENTIMQDVVGTTNNPTTFSQSGLWSIQGAVTTGIRPGASSSRRVLAVQNVVDTYGLSLSTGWAMVMAGIRGIVNTPSGGGVQSVTSSDDIIDVDNTDPENPVLSLDVEELANDTTFITELTNNSTFQTEVNNFVSGGGGGGVKLAIDTNEVTVTGTTTETTLFTTPIPSGTLGTNDAISFYMYGTLQDGAGSDTVTYRVKYGATTVGTLTISPQFNGVPYEFILRGSIIADNSTSAQKCSIEILFNYAPNVSFEGLITDGTATEDSTIIQNLAITAENSDIATTTTAEAIIVEKISSQGSGSSLEIQQNGSTIATGVTQINITGNASVTTPGAGQVEIDITGGGGSGEGNQITIQDEFMGGMDQITTANYDDEATVGDLGWKAVLDSAGSSIGYLSGEENHPGIYHFNSDKNDENRIYLNSVRPMVNGAIFRWKIRPIIVQGNTSMVGLGTNGDAGGINFINVQFAPFGGGVIILNTSDATTTETTTLAPGTFVSGTWYDVEIRITSSSVVFSIDGVVVATHSTNIPDVSSVSSPYVKTGYGDDLDIDYFSMYDPNATAQVGGGSGTIISGVAAQDLVLSDVVFLSNGSEIKGFGRNVTGSGSDDINDINTNYYYYTLFTVPFDCVLDEIYIGFFTRRFSTTIELRNVSSGIPGGTVYATASVASTPTYSDKAALLSSIGLTVAAGTELALKISLSNVDPGENNASFLTVTSVDDGTSQSSFSSTDDSTWNAIDVLPVSFKTLLTNGKVYKSDTEIFKGAVDGIVTTNVSTGATATIQTSGTFITSGLTSGSKYYLDPTTPGGIDTTQAGEFVGFALSTTELDVLGGSNENSFPITVANTTGSGHYIIPVVGTTYFNIAGSGSSGERSQGQIYSWLPYNEYVTIDGDWPSSGFTPSLILDVENSIYYTGGFISSTGHANDRYTGAILIPTGSIFWINVGGSSSGYGGLVVSPNKG